MKVITRGISVVALLSAADWAAATEIAGAMRGQAGTEVRGNEGDTDLLGENREKVADVRDAANNKLSDLKGKVSDAAGAGRNIFEEIMANAKAALERATAAVTSAYTTFEQNVKAADKKLKSLVTKAKEASDGIDTLLSDAANLTKEKFLTGLRKANVAADKLDQELGTAAQNVKQSATEVFQAVVEKTHTAVKEYASSVYAKMQSLATPEQKTVFENYATKFEALANEAFNLRKSTQQTADSDWRAVENKAKTLQRDLERDLGTVSNELKPLLQESEDVVKEIVKNPANANAAAPRGTMGISMLCVGLVTCAALLF